MNRGAVTCALLALLASAAEARPIEAFVFDDANGDGKPGPGEAGVPGAVVAITGTRQFRPTDERGRVTLDGDAGLAWVRVPDGFRPGPVWARLDGLDTIALPLVRWQPPSKPLTFVAAADAHTNLSHAFWDDLEDASFAATHGNPPPAFFTILGDITQNTTPQQFVVVDRLLTGVDVPFVPVPGNHDWYDAGAAWRAHYGPENYSFDIGTVHFVVWNMVQRDEDAAEFFQFDLERVPPEMTVVGMTHGPPSAALVAKLRELGVDHVLSGHTHTNRVIDHGGLLELSTEPMLMGGLDFTPAGYRVISIDRGVLTSEHRTTVDRPSVRVIAPAAGQCLPPAGGALLAATELPPAGTTVTARLDCGTPIALAYLGGWTWRAALPALSPGPHAVTLEATSSDGDRLRALATIAVCEPERTPLGTGAWPQLGGNAAHTGAIAGEVAPPLAARWTQAVGGHVMHGAPAIANGMIFVTVTDLAGGDTGGIVALDLATGAIRWRANTALPVRGAATVARDLVAVVQVDGTVLGFDAATGTERWRYELGIDLPPKAAATYGSVLELDGDLVAGNQRRLATLDAATGRPLWVRDPVRGQSEFPSLATVAAADGVAVGVFDRELGGLYAWDHRSAELLWNVFGWDALSINASPVISDGVVYFSNGSTEVYAYELATGAKRWRVKLDPNGYDWAIATIGTPAIAQGVLVVPTLWRDLAGLDASSGRVLWRLSASAGSELRTTHYRGRDEPGWASTPVITGSIVWAADTAGQLVALDLHTGAVLWRDQLDVPVLAGLATTGDALVVASYDGTVRVLAPTTRAREAPLEGTCDAPPPQGCCDARAAATTPFLAALVVLAASYARRRRRTSPSATRPSAAPKPEAPPASHA